MSSNNDARNSAQSSASSAWGRSPWNNSNNRDGGVIAQRSSVGYGLASSPFQFENQVSPSAQLESLVESMRNLQLIAATNPEAKDKIVALEKQLSELKRMMAPWTTKEEEEVPAVESGLDEIDVKHLIGGKLFDEVVEEKKVSTGASSSAKSYGGLEERNGEERNELKRNHHIVMPSKNPQADQHHSTFASVVNGQTNVLKTSHSKSGRTVTPRELTAENPLVFNDSRTEVKHDSNSTDLHQTNSNQAFHLPVKKAGNKSGYVCHLCKAVGDHKIHECPERFQIQKAGKKFVCKLCQGPHIVYKCPQFKHSVPTAGYICKICGEDGDHWFYNCPHK